MSDYKDSFFFSRRHNDSIVPTIIQTKNWTLSKDVLEYIVTLAFFEDSGAILNLRLVCRQFKDWFPIVLPKKLDDSVIYSSKRREFLSWLVTLGSMLGDSLRFCGRTLAEWLKQEYFIDWNESICSDAAARGDLPFLKWARRSKCPWNYNVTSLAAKYNHRDVLIYALQNHCSAKEVFWVAGYTGNEVLLDLALEYNCPWDQLSCASAGVNGHLCVLQWARKHHLPFNLLLVYNNAKEGNQQCIITWLMNTYPRQMDCILRQSDELE